MEEKRDNQAFHYDTKRHFEPVRKAVANTCKQVITGKKPTSKTIEALREPKMSILKQPLQLAFDQEINSSDFFDKQLEIMFMKKTIAKNSGLNHLKFFTWVTRHSVDQVGVVEDRLFIKRGYRTWKPI